MFAGGKQSGNERHHAPARYVEYRQIHFTLGVENEPDGGRGTRRAPPVIGEDYFNKISFFASRAPFISIV